VILADPPWRFVARSPKGLGRSPDRHYQTMTLDEIKGLPVGDLAARDCWLFMWVTGPMLPTAFEIATAWGFRYSSRAFVWIKLNPRLARCAPFFYDAQADLATGQGYTTRKNAEDCLLFRRGQPKRLARDIREVIVSPRREHSRKPDEAHERIERFATGPYCELFARQRRCNWAAWGNQVDRFGGEVGVKT
jgi:N6-adenosine-specific RNA methylase IME4